MIVPCTIPAVRTAPSTESRRSACSESSLIGGCGRPVAWNATSLRFAWRAESARARASAAARTAGRIGTTLLSGFAMKRRSADKRVDRDDVAQIAGPPGRRPDLAVHEELRERRVDRDGIHCRDAAIHRDANVRRVDGEAVHRRVLHVGGERRLHCLGIEAAPLRERSRGERCHGPARGDAAQIEQPQARVEIVSLLGALEIELAGGRELAAIGEVQIGREIERAHRAAEMHRAARGAAQPERGRELPRGDERDRVEAHVGGHAALAGIDHFAVRHHSRELVTLVMREVGVRRHAAGAAIHRPSRCP